MTSAPELVQSIRRRKTINVNPGSLTCAGCKGSITSRYLLGALKKYWHEDCLQCDTCKNPVIQIGESLYYRSGKKLCASDYAKAFGKPGMCAMCEETIQATEYALKFKNNLCYHVECFYCTSCKRSFCVGDEFVMSNEKEIYCLEDFRKKHTDKKQPSKQEK